MEAPTVDPVSIPGQVQQILEWYTQGFVTEEELVYLLSNSIDHHPET